MEGGFFTLVLTFFLNIFYSRIVDSVFCCMFTPSQRSDTKQNTTIMKKQYNTFENIGYSVVLLAMFFIGSFAILSVYKLLSLLLGVDA